jgi:allantoate deiminase
LQLFGFVEEEGVLFHSALIGSRFFSGELSERNLRELLTPEGLSCAEMAQHFCTNLNPIMEGVLPQEAYDLAFFLEPHIEQGPVLERENISLGVVTSITGTTMTEITFFGEANHAGTTPMDIRKDPVRGMIHLGNRLEEKLSQVPRVVGTIGRILVDPNVGNVIPSQVCFTVDIRCVEKKTLQKLLEGLKIWGQEAAEKFRLKVEFLQGHQVMPLQMDAKLQEELGRQAAKLHMPSMGLHSGAGHDALSMARICPVGMVFVPSKNGKSHCPEESSDFEHLGQVARMLWEVIQQQDRIL